MTYLKSWAIRPKTFRNSQSSNRKVNFSNSHTRLLLTVAALFIFVLFLVYHKLKPQKHETIKDQGTVSALSYSKSTDGSLRPEVHDKKKQLSKQHTKLPDHSNVNPQDPLLSDLRELARESPLDALDHVLAMAPNANQKRSMALVFNEWAKHDPEAAANWIMQNLWTPQQLRTTAAIALATVWVGSVPEIAIQWTDDYFNRTQDHHAFQKALITWSKQDLGAAAQHMATTSYGDTIGYIATAEFVNIYAQQDVYGAMQWVQANTPEEFQSDAQMEIIDELTKKNPIRAADYVLQANNLTNIESNLDALLLQWTNTDPLAARQWVEQSLNPSQQEIAYSQLAELFRDQQPEVAIEYAQALSDDKFRVDTTTDILSSWRDQKPLAADRWISINADNLDPVMLEDIGYFNLTP